MKLMTPDGSELMHVKSVDVRGSQLVVEGIIMGAMPMMAVVTPKEMRSALKLLSVRKIIMLIGLMFRR